MTTSATAITRLIGALARRVRLTRALEAAARAALTAAGALAVALVWHKFSPVAPAAWRVLVLIAILAVIVAAAAGFMRRVSRLAAAKSADVRLGLDDRLSSAVEFLSLRRGAPAWAPVLLSPVPNSEKPRKKQKHWRTHRSAPAQEGTLTDLTPFMLAHLADAAACAEKVRAAEALPVCPPKSLRALAASLIVLGFLLIVPGRASQRNGDGPGVGTVPISLPPMRFPGERTADAMLARIDPYRDPQLHELMRELKELYAAAREGALTREEALARIGDAEVKLRAAESARSDPDRSGQTWRRSVEKALAEKGKELVKDPATAALGRAMSESNLDEASKESRSLAGDAAATPPKLKLTEEQSKALAELMKSAAEAGGRELDVLSKELGGAADALSLDDMKEFAKQLEEAAKEFERLKAEMEKMAGLARTDEELEEMKQALGALEQDASGRWVMRLGRGGREGGGFFEMTGVEPPEKGKPESGIGSTPEGPGTGGPPERTNVTTTPADLTGRPGQGASLVEIVKGAASEGVAGEAYREAAEAAARAAEDAVHSEDIPLGYRLYVKRYFQTIQPNRERN